MILFNTTPKPLLGLVFAAVSFCAAPSYAETDAQLMASGQWRDPATGLIWMRCLVGQRWTGSTCVGEPFERSWGYANDLNLYEFAGRKNWRLPRVEELVTIRRCSTGWAHQVITESRLTTEGSRDFRIDKGIHKITLLNGRSVPRRCAHGSGWALDEHIFPGTKNPHQAVWSSSSSENPHYYAWYVSFLSGEVSTRDKSFNHNVRGVRTAR